YAEPIDQAGFVFMDSPGYDPVATTGQIASGANLICFTTGRGSMFGSKPAPTIKLASNTPMFQRLEEDMDINCGAVIDGECDMAQMGQRIFEHLLRIASGQRSKSELLGLGDHGAPQQGDSQEQAGQELRAFHLGFLERNGTRD
ncbi:MAG: hypothetical protein CFE45_38240, partial [Burkholderiales bacterium PBB5]